MIAILRWICAAAFASLLLPLQAQTYDSPNAGPWRTMSEGEDGRLMLMGYDAVAYFTQNDAVKGNPAIKTEHLGVTYRFASEANKAQFLKSPAKYMPQFGGERVCSCRILGFESIGTKREWM